MLSSVAVSLFGFLCYAICVGLAQPTGHPLTSCVSDADCHADCPAPEHSVCSLPEQQCHCHADGNIECNTTADCLRECNNTAAVCFSDHHCHCHEDHNDQGHQGHPLTSCVSDADCHADCPALEHSVCSLPEQQCRCHASGNIECMTNTDCESACNNPAAVCFNDHHCHCEGDHQGPGHNHGGHDHAADPKQPLNPCIVDSDCQGVCAPPQQGVCNVPDFQCHCHDYGNLPCNTSSDCHSQCGHRLAMCHDDHHCHCYNNAMDLVLSILMNRLAPLLRPVDRHPETPCSTDADCHQDCPSAQHSVCSARDNKCHCHAYGFLPCSSTVDCWRQCNSFTSFCHGDHHCHC